MISAARSLSRARFALAAAALMILFSGSFALSYGYGTHGENIPNPAVKQPSSDADRIEPLARWLADQDNERMRAAGLAYLSSAAHGGEEFNADALLDRLEKAIETTTDGAALAWLASSCASAGIADFCIGAGLDDAIVRHDEANLLSRGALYPDPDAETRKRLIVEAESTENHTSELTVIWYEALKNGPGAESLKTSHDTLVGAFSISMAYAVPGYQILTTTCGEETTFGTDLDSACTQLIDELALNAKTLIDKSIGLAVKAKRTEARGDHELASQLEQRNVYENARSSCISRKFESMLKSGRETVAHEYMELLGEHGELEAQSRFAERHEIDCSNPRDPMEDILEYFEEQIESDS